MRRRPGLIADYRADVAIFRSNVSRFWFAVLLVAAAVIGIGWASIGLFNAMQMWLGPIWGPAGLGALMILPLLSGGFVPSSRSPAGSKESPNTSRSRPSSAPSAASSPAPPREAMRHGPSVGPSRSPSSA